MGYSFNTNCPHCNTQLQLDSDWIGINVQCAQCGKTFCVEEPSMPQALPTSMIAPPAPPAPDQPMPMMPPPQPGTRNKSTASLVLGILGLIPGLFISPIGFILALIALIIGCKKKFTAGIVLGIIGLVLNLLSLLFLLAILLPALSTARERARTASCVSNMKQLGLSFLMYSGDYRDQLPPYKGQNGMKLLQNNGYIFGEYKCPSSERKNPYAYIGEGLIMGRDNPSLPILIEYPKNHPKQINVLYLDGHVQTHSIPENYKTIHQVAEYILEENNINSYDKGAAIVLANAKRFK